MKKCLRIVLSAYYAGQWTKEERRCFLSSIYGGCKRGNTEWKKRNDERRKRDGERSAALKYRERNEEKRGIISRTINKTNNYAGLNPAQKKKNYESNRNESSPHGGNQNNRSIRCQRIGRDPRASAVGGISECIRISHRIAWTTRWFAWIDADDGIVRIY